jgi:hypothetical protein
VIRVFQIQVQRVLKSEQINRNPSSFLQRLHKIQLLYFLLASVVLSGSIALSGCGGLTPNSASPGAGSLTASPTTVAFGSVTVGSPATSHISLVNSSSGPVVISQLTVSSKSFSYDGLGTLPFTLAANSTATLNVHFGPSTAGAASAELVIASISPGSTSTTVQMTGTGVATAPSAAGAGLTVSSRTVAFGSVAVGTPSIQPVTLTSSGTAAVIVSGGTLSGTGFTMSGVTFPLTLNAGQTATLNLQFDPAAAGAATGNLTLTSDAEASPSDIVQMTGTGVAAAPPAAGAGLTVSSSTVAFGSVAVGTPSTQSLTLTSSGTTALIVSGATLSGAGFTMSGATFPLTLNAGQTATLSLQFDPTATGAATGTLTISSDAPSNSTAIAALSGTGVPLAVDLSWTAPSDSTIAGFNIYRAAGSSSSYSRLNTSVSSPVSYTDSTVQAGITYEYYVTTVDSSGAESVPSNTASVVVP